jgi:hypothetical protein
MRRASRPDAARASRPRRRRSRAPRRRRATARALAHRWLLGDLDAEVTVPVAVACAALGLDADALAGTVRLSQGEQTTRLDANETMAEHGRRDQVLPR